jgi:hypothetical protein
MPKALVKFGPVAATTDGFETCVGAPVHVTCSALELCDSCRKPLGSTLWSNEGSPGVYCCFECARGVSNPVVAERVRFKLLKLGGR